MGLFLYTAAFLAAAVSLAALFSGTGTGHDHGTGPISDITVNLGGRPVREHCTTCHPQGGLPGSDAPHPDIAPHSWSTLGCTGCHLGEGMALDEEISHGLPGYGARQVLKGKDLQASCYKCHELTPLEGADKAWRGYGLYRRTACGACHSLSPAEPGGRYGPPLDTIGSTLGLRQIEEAIREPKKEPPNSIMPRFPLSSGQARQIAWFLKSRVRDPLYATPMEVKTGKVPLPEVTVPLPEGLPPAGETLAQRLCLACHRFGGEDGLVAPDLTWIGSMRDSDYLRAFLENPARRIPGAIMPQVPMEVEEKEGLISFLSGQATGPLTLEHSGERDFEGPLPAAGGEAKHLYMALCQRCHAASGDGFGLIQPNLSTFPRAFAGNGDFFRTAPDERLVRSIGKGIPGTSMPPYEGLLEREQVDTLLDLLFSAFIGIPREEKSGASPLAVAGPVLPERADTLYSENCSRCHGQSGTGKGPEHLRHLPRPRNLTNRPYFASLEDDRIAVAIADGVPGTAMPAFRDRLSAAEIRGLKDRVRRFSGEHDERTSEPRAPQMAP